MFEVSEEASKKIKEFLAEQKGLQAIRILVTEGGWRGPFLVMALDEQKEDDEVFTDRGVTFLVEKSLFEKANPISIDYVHSTFGSGYILNSELMKHWKGGVFGGCRNICESCEDFK
ncbi:Fe-S cluster assembly iron-binding protein IscA [Syntrophus gentianae]|uniref:Fe-S cluster assembly iron-binding protein IscA n=1 Tax=Syntrophus gentianae TaxID=43775 RepID=A0A1H7WRJ9_9BACT|nr:IscA/HesB family protein [Syntrophus gentianae]SEM23668.1 Fe-S cluster assembly iron-binding protein IscA [Syntrophus gentianae]